MGLILNAEGVDGAGKSETCKRIALALGAVLYSTPPAAHLDRRHEVDALASDWEHYQFYLRGVQLASEELAVLARDPRPVVVDRYWLTTVAYHRAMGVDAKLSDFGSITLPDLVLYFEVRPEVQAVRLAKRGMTAGDRRMLDRMTRAREEYERLLATVPHVRIDTSDRCIDEVVADTIRRLPLVAG